MARQFFTGEPFGKRIDSFGRHRGVAGLQMADIVGFRQGQGDLAAADELQINIGEKLGVQQRAVLCAFCNINAVTLAERVKAVGTHGVAFLGERQRINDPLIKNWRPLDESQFGIQKTNIKAGVVNYQDRIPNELKEFIGNARECGFVLQKIARLFREPLQLRGARHVAD